MPTLHKTLSVCICQGNISLMIHGTMSDQDSGDEVLKNKKLYTYAHNYDSKEFKMYH